MRLRYRLTMLPGLIAAFLLSLMPVNGYAQSGAPQAGEAKPVADQAAALEERLIDLQVQIVTVRSLARSVAPAATAVAHQRPFQAISSDAGSAQQVQALDGEVRSLTAQIKQLTGTAPLILPAATQARAPAPDNRSQLQGRAPGPVPQPGNGQTPPGNIVSGGALVAPQASASNGWAGSTTVTPGAAIASRGDQRATPSVGEILPGTVYPGYGQKVPGQAGSGQLGSERAGSGQAGSAQGVPAGNAAGNWAKPQSPVGTERRALAPRTVTPGGASDPETEYQTAYGYLLQQDYGAAQTAFKEFLARYPKTALAGNAQYWIGETYYARGAYKNAAVAFLKGYETYGDGNKGADSLLKLGMSLGKLRQTAAACSSLRELGKRYRDAPDTTRARARTEMSRLRCPN